MGSPPQVETAEGPPGESSKLPSYLSRHVHMGFSSEDVLALIDSIDASQSSHSSARWLPHIPAEILFRIVTFVPIDYILPWRLVCRGVRDYIDGPLMFSYLTRLQVIGYLGAWPKHQSRTRSHFTHKEYDEICFVRCNFQSVQAAESEDTAMRIPMWNRPRAVFRIEEKWYKILHSGDRKPKIDQVYDILSERLQTRVMFAGHDDAWGTLAWCLRLDSAVQDLELPIVSLQDHLQVDFPNKTVTWNWKDHLFRLIQTESTLRALIEQHKSSESPAFTFNLVEDCLRDVRRKRMLASLSSRPGGFPRVRWGLRMMPTLYGRPRYDVPAEGFNRLEQVENSAVSTLMILRREAGMTEKEAMQLRRLAIDRKKIDNELAKIERLYTNWISGVGVELVRPSYFRLPNVPSNPFAWDEKTLATEVDRIKKWTSQERNMSKVALLLEASAEVFKMPEDAFDDSISDL